MQAEYNDYSDCPSGRSVQMGLAHIVATRARHLNFGCGIRLSSTHQCGASVVQRVVAAQLLAEAVLNARQLHHHAHGTASNHTGTH